MNLTSEHEHEYHSQCCGVKEGEVEGLCPWCRDWTGFECECGGIKAMNTINDHRIKLHQLSRSTKGRFCKVTDPDVMRNKDGAALVFHCCPPLRLHLDSTQRL